MTDKETGWSIRRDEEGRYAADDHYYLYGGVSNYRDAEKVIDQDLKAGGADDDITQNLE